MTRIQQSIDVSVPVHAAYLQLSQFEDYPRFMQDVETVMQVDETHLHWSTKLSYQTMEWDAEITEQMQDRCIAWRNLTGPTNNAKVELQPVGDDSARITLTMECEPSELLVAPDGNTEALMAQRLEQDLARFKEFIEAHETDQGTQAAAPEHGAPAPTSGYAAGSEGWDGTEDPVEPATPSIKPAAGQQQPSAALPPAGSQAQRTMQSAPSLSQSADDQVDDERYSVAEEQNFDQQSDQARRVGQMPQDANATGAAPSEAIAESLEQEGSPQQGKARLKQAIDRAIPPSE